MIDRNRGFFITGTDTDIGKTVAAASVLCALRESGVNAAPMKPVQSGSYREDGRLKSPDLEFCLNVASLTVSDATKGEMVPYLFEPACSPHLAAAMAGVNVSFERIGEAAANLLQTYDSVVVEGAGGLLVPIDETRSMLELAAYLGFPVVVVARLGLGSINHTLLTLRELERAGLKTEGVVFCESIAAKRSYIEDDNLKTIQRWGNIPVLGIIPHMAGLSQGRITPEEFRRIAVESLPVDRKQLRGECR